MDILSLAMVLGCCLSSGASPFSSQERNPPEGLSYSENCWRLTNFDLNKAEGNRDKYIHVEYTPQYHLFDYLDELFPGLNGAPNLSYTPMNSNSVPGFVENLYPYTLYPGSALPHAADKNPLYEAQRRLLEEGKINDGQSLGCGPIAMFSLLDYLAREGGCPWIYDWQQDGLVFENQVELMKDIWNCSVVIQEPGGSETGMLPVWFGNALSLLMEKKGMDGLWTMKALAYIESVTPDMEEYFMSVIDAGYPFIINCGPTARFYRNHYITVTGYEEWNVRTMHDIKKKVMFRVNENWMMEDPCYYDIDWLGQHAFDDVWVLLPDGEVSGLEEVTVDAGDMPFGTGYPGLATHDAVPVDTSGGTFQMQTIRLRTQNYEDECIVLSPRRENFGSAWIEFCLPVPFYRAELDVSFWRSWEKEGIDEDNYNLSISWRIAPGMPLAEWRDYSEELDRIPQDRTKPCTIPVAFQLHALRIDVSCLGAGDSNKGRFVINGLKFWIRPSDVERCLNGRL